MKPGATPGDREPDDDAYAADFPYIAGTILGIREWSTDRELTVLNAAMLTGEWETDGTPTTATCSFAPDGHEAPDPDCQCGLYARHPWTAEGRSLYRTWPADPERVVGIVAAWGRIEVHREGFRAQHARPVALLLPGLDTCPGQFCPKYRGRLRRLAERCGAELIDLERTSLDAWLGEHPGQLDEATLEQLMPEVAPGSAPGSGAPASPLPDRTRLDSVLDGAALLARVSWQATFGLMVVMIGLTEWLMGALFLYILLLGLTGLDPLGLAR